MFSNKEFVNKTMCLLSDNLNSYTDYIHCIGSEVLNLSVSFSFMCRKFGTKCSPTEFVKQCLSIFCRPTRKFN